MSDVFTSFTTQLTHEVRQLSIHTNAGKDRYVTYHGFKSDGKKTKTTNDYSNIDLQRMPTTLLTSYRRSKILTLHRILSLMLSTISHFPNFVQYTTINPKSSLLDCKLFYIIQPTYYRTLHSSKIKQHMYIHVLQEINYSHQMTYLLLYKAETKALQL